MLKRILPLTITVLMAFVMFAGCQGGTAKKPAPKSPSTPPAAATPKTLQEIAAKDPYNNGCVSCHKKTGDVDRTLPAYVKRIAGHPEVKEGTVNACYVCHDAQKNYSLYVRFYKRLHKIHWGSDIFSSKLKGQCYSCHTVETNGVAGIKNYPLAGYRSSLSGSNNTRSAKPESVPPAGQQTTPGKTEQSTKQPAKSQTPTSNKSGGTTGNKSGSTTGSAQSGVTDIPTPTP